MGAAALIARDTNADDSARDAIGRPRRRFLSEVLRALRRILARRPCFDVGSRRKTRRCPNGYSRRRWELSQSTYPRTQRKNVVRQRSAQTRPRLVARAEDTVGLEPMWWKTRFRPRPTMLSSRDPSRLTKHAESASVKISQMVKLAAGDPGMIAIDLWRIMSRQV